LFPHFHILGDRHNQGATEPPRRIILPVIKAKNRSTWFNHELRVGV